MRANQDLTLRLSVIYFPENRSFDFPQKNACLFLFCKESRKNSKSAKMSEKFIETLQNNQTAFNLELEKNQLEKLSDYYELVRQNNSLLHLVAPSSEEEFGPG